jgi:hypothetical protein
MDTFIRGIARSMRYKTLAAILCVGLLITFIPGLQSGCLSNKISTSTEATTGQSIEADRLLILDYVKNGPEIWLSEYTRNDQFTMVEPYIQFRKYQARLYQCTWKTVIQGKDDTVERSFLIKCDKIYEILTWDNADQLFEIDFDHDRAVELIYYTNFGSGRSIDTFYVLEQIAEEPIYITEYDLAGPIRVMNNDLVIAAMTVNQKWVTGKLKYRITNGKKEIYIDAGQYTDQLQSLSQDSMNSENISEISIGDSKSYVDALLGKPKYQTYYKEYDLYDCFYIMSGAVVRTVYLTGQVEAFFITRTNNRLTINLYGYEYLTGNKELSQFSYYEIDGKPEYVLSLMQNGTGCLIYYEQYHWGSRGNYKTFIFADLPYGAVRHEICNENDYYLDDNFKGDKISSADFGDQIFIYFNRRESYPSTLGIVNDEKIDIETIHEILLDWSSIDYNALIRDTQ